MRNTLIWFNEYLKAWVWSPIKRAAMRLWDANFGPCCDNPKLTWHEGPGFTISTCRNCKKTKTNTRAGF